MQEMDAMERREGTEFSRSPWTGWWTLAAARTQGLSDDSTLVKIPSFFI
jgi:hypothetical protein